MPGAMVWPNAAGPRQDDTFTLEDLLQELFMALMGYTGDVFVDTSPADHTAELQQPGACTISLAKDILLASNVSRDQLNQLVRVGFHYKQLRAFMREEQHPQDGRASMYRRALCSGLEEVCAVYEDEVVLLQEQLLLHGAAQGLPGISYQLADLQRLMPQLHQLAWELRRRPRHTLTEAQRLAYDTTTSLGSGGCCWSSQQVPDAAGGADGVGSAAGAGAGAGAPLMGGLDGGPGLLLVPGTSGAGLLVWLHERRLNGEPLLQASIQRLLWHVNQVLFNQLTMWMAHGLLVDGGAEFFIQPSVTMDDADAAGCGSSSGADTQPQRDRREAGGGGISGLVPAASAEDSYRDFHVAFGITLTELPPSISPHAATSIEFVGRAVRLMRSPPASAKLSALQGGSTSSISSSTGRAQQQRQGPQQQQGQAAGGVLQGAEASPQQLLPQGDVMAYAAALRVLQQQPVLSEAALERTVEAIRADVASRLWQLLVVRCGLTQHLVAIKDYMLCARGDFFSCFLANAAKLMGNAPNMASVDKDLGVLWQSAAAKTTAAEDPYFGLFRLVYDAQPREPHKDGSAWANLKVEARLPWPLGVLVTSRHQERYNSLFQLLLPLKRVQLCLEAAWQAIGRLCGRRGGGRQTGFTTELLQLRQHMAHVVSNLQVYLQLDVVETNFELLLQRVAAAQDYEELGHAHQRFLDAIHSQSLMGVSGVASSLACLLCLAHRLCVQVHRADEAQAFTPHIKQEIQGIKAEFTVTALDFYAVLHAPSLRTQDAAPYLDQLQVRLHFNKHFQEAIAARVKVKRQQLSPYKQDKQQRDAQQRAANKAREAGPRRGLAATGLV